MNDRAVRNMYSTVAPAKYSCVVVFRRVNNYAYIPYNQVMSLQLL